MSVPTVDPFGGLEGSDRDVYAAVTNMLREYGLESLAPTVLAYIEQGYSSDTINALLPTTDTYKQRFAGNEARRQKGLPVLSPAEYLATERAYRQVMSAAGLPVGFYDSPQDFEKFIANDTSPVEVQERVRVAEEMVNSIDPASRSAFEQFYTTGDMIAYALDQERATTVLDRQWRAAQAAGAARDQGVDVSRDAAERIAAVGTTADQARQGFGAVAAVARETRRLSQIYGGDYTEGDAIDEVFFQSAAATRKRGKLASQERAQFSGSGGVGATSLSARSGGQV